LEKNHQIVNWLSRVPKGNVILISGAAVIILFFLWFTNYLVNELSKEEINKVTKLAWAYQALNQQTENLTEQLNIIQSDKTTRIIIIDENEKIKLVNNFPPEVLNDSIYLYNQLKTIKLFHKPIYINFTKDIIWKVYYKEKDVITLLRFYPYLQLVLISLFLMIAYVGFNTTRKFQQNKVWVGMAKETAHQIGTPLSSLLAWVEYMREVKEPPTEEVLFEMEKDLERLQIITERFSKIGSTPEYQSLNVYDLVNESVTYLSKRISKKVIITILNTSDKDIYAKINRNLFSWVIENLTKNAVDAMLGEGKIIFNLYVFKNDIIIDVADTGKGIQKSQFTKVFEPGFTTKKRGWGLGLSLAKRIIEEYHQGRIFVKDSEIGKGTTFRIMLTKINSNQSS